MAELITTSELARRAQVTKRTIRYYVAEGLLPQPLGTEARQLFGREHEVRLRLVKLLRAEGLPLRRIRLELDGKSLAEMEAMLASADEVRGHVLGPRQVLDRLRARGDTLEEVADAYAVQPVPEAPSGLWRRVVLAEGVELHVRTGMVDHRERAVEAVIEFAVKRLGGE